MHHTTQNKTLTTNHAKGLLRLPSLSTFAPESPKRKCYPVWVSELVLGSYQEDAQIIALDPVQFSGVLNE